jgi:hypothetical protein
MSLLDTYKTHNLVTLATGCLFVAGGLWIVCEFMIHGVRTVAGGIFIFVVCVAPITSVEAAIIHNQLRLRREAKGSPAKHLSS